MKMQFVCAKCITHVVLLQIRMVRFEAIVENCYNDTAASNALSPGRNHVHVEAIAAILHHSHNNIEKNEY